MEGRSVRTPPLDDGRDDRLEASPFARISAVLDATWDPLVDLRGRVLVAALVLLTIVRGGVRFDRDEWTLLAVGSFPEPLADWRANSPPGVALAGLLGVDTMEGWLVLNLGFLAIAVVVTAAVLRRRFPTSGGVVVASTWLAVSAVPIVMAQRIGSYDVFTVVGAVLAVLGRRPAIVLAGGLLIGATSFEQGVLGLAGALTLLVLLDAGGRGAVARAVRRDALGPALVGVVLGRAVVLGWFRVTGVTVPGRSAVFGDLVASSLSRSAAAGLAGVWAWLGGAWALLAVGWAVGRWDRGRSVLVVAALVGPGALATVTTADGTRVFAMVSLPALLVLVAWLADQHGPGATGRAVARATTAILLAAPLLPAIIAEPKGGVFFGFPWEGLATGVALPR